MGLFYHSGDGHTCAARPLPHPDAKKATFQSVKLTRPLETQRRARGTTWAPGTVQLARGAGTAGPWTPPAPPSELPPWARGTKRSGSDTERHRSKAENMCRARGGRGGHEGSRLQNPNPAFPGRHRAPPCWGSSPTGCAGAPAAQPARGTRWAHRGCCGLGGHFPPRARGQQVPAVRPFKPQTASVRPSAGG